MAELKTKPNQASVLAFLKSVEPKQKRDDSLTLLRLFQKLTGKKPMMWGTSIVGFGMYHYKSERSSQEGDWPLVAFSPRKQNLTLYVLGYGHQQAALLKKLGKHKLGISCLYINTLADVDIKILAQIIKSSYQSAKKRLVR